MWGGNTEPPMTSKYWVFTSHTTEHTPVWCDKTMDFLVYQLEKAPSTGKEHWQGYVELKNASRMKKAQKEIGHAGAHMETRKGTAWQAYQYCIKADTAAGDDYFVYGKEPKEEHKGQGRRTDLESLALAAIEGKKIQEMDEKHPGAMLKYDKNYIRMQQRHIKQRKFKTEVIVIYGPTGAGKSKIINDLAPEAYWQEGQWWDGYCGEQDVIIDDINAGAQTRTFWLRLFDRYPLKVPYKGGMSEFVSKRIFVTTCARPEWILDDPEMLRRVEPYELKSLPGEWKLVPLRAQALPGHSPSAVIPPELLAVDEGPSQGSVSA